MPKNWSVTTTVRNPERVRDFLKASQQLEGEEWSLETQEKFQILLIQNRYYGYGQSQFTNTLSKEQEKIFNDFDKALTYSEAKEIFVSKNYEDPPMRGRQSFNVLSKFGFALIRKEDKRVYITELGKQFLQDDFDISNIFLKCFLKWQLPNPNSTTYKKKDGYNIKPFVASLHLIKKVNELETSKGRKAKGLSREEFYMFCPTLINYEEIYEQAKRISTIRDKIEDKPKKTQDEIFDYEINKYLVGVLGSNVKKELTKFKKDLKDYGDNALRYFRLTSFIHLRGKGNYVDLEPNREIEIFDLLDEDDGSIDVFSSKEEYIDYLIDINRPVLPWEKRSERIKIYKNIVDSIRHLEKLTGQPAIKIDGGVFLNDNEIQGEIDKLRLYRTRLNENLDKQSSQKVDNIRQYLNDLTEISESISPAIELERLSTLCLNALNDAIKIKPNYPLGDDNNPTNTAPGNRPDIECYYEEFNAICEVTMLKDRSQWYYEGQPVMRHLRDFEEKYSEKKAYCLFIAPLVHRDTMNQFFTTNKYEYEGRPQNIVPLTIEQFSKILETLIEMKNNGRKFNHYNLLSLYRNIVENASEVASSTAWLNDIDNQIDSWKEEILIKA